MSLKVRETHKAHCALLLSKVIFMNLFFLKSIKLNKNGLGPCVKMMGELKNAFKCSAVLEKTKKVSALSSDI